MRNLSLAIILFAFALTAFCAPKWVWMGATGNLGPAGGGGFPAGGGGGGSPTNNPPATNNIIEWLKADAITPVANGTAISTWPATIGNNATADASSPTYATPFQNSLPGVAFNGTSQGMSAGSLNQAQPFTAAIAFKYNGSLTSFSYIVGDTTLVLGTYNTSQFYTQFGGSSIFTNSNNGFNYIVLVINGASTKESFNGGGFVSVSNPGALALAILGLGWSPTASAEYSNVTLGEAIIWKDDESANLAAINTYLFNKWQ